jgi:hypothetical protein
MALSSNPKEGILFWFYFKENRSEEKINKVIFGVFPAFFVDKKLTKITNLRISGKI